MNCALPEARGLRLSQAMKMAEKLQALGYEVLLTSSRGTLARLMGRGLMELQAGGGMRPCFLSAADLQDRSNWGLRCRKMGGAGGWMGLQGARALLHAMEKEGA